VSRQLNEPDLSGGEVTVGPYLLREFLGRGGMATVFLGEHAQQGTPVALKVVRPRDDIDRSVLDPFLHEARSMASLTHPSIVRVHDFGWVDAGRWLPGEHTPGTPTTWLAMDHVAGGTLRDLRGAPWLDWPTLKKVLLELLDALAYAHSWGLVHRDVKPANVLVHRLAPTLGGVLLSDFGLAHAGETRESDGQVENAAGTPRYMAPEQLRGRWRDYGPWTDLFAVAWLAWEIAAGTSPLAGLSHGQVIAAQLGHHRPEFKPVFDVPRGLRDWIDVLLSPDPRDRFQTANEANNALQALDASRARPVTIVPKTWRRTSRPGALLPGTGLGLLGLRKPPTTGRRAERDALWAALKAVDRLREGRAIALTGDAGVGKSHLTVWLKRRVKELAAGFVAEIRHSAEPGRADGVPGMLRRLLVCEGLPRPEMRRRLELDAELAPLEGDYDRLGLLELMSPLDGSGEYADRVVLATAEERHRLVARALLRRSMGRPLVLCIDDAQWGADALGLALHLLRSGAPALVVAAVRPDAERASSEAARLLTALYEEGATGLRIEPLGDREQRALLEALLPLDRGLARRLVERSQGNPLFALQLLGDLAERNALEPQNGTFALRPDASQDLPSGIRALWSRRVSTALGHHQAARQALWIAAALGLDVDADEWSEACAIANVSGTDALDRLADAGLARAGLAQEGGGWTLSHTTLREALLEEAADAGWTRPAHAACFAALQDAPPSRLAPHLEALGRSDEAFDLWVEAEWPSLSAGDWGLAERARDGARRCLEAASADEDDPRWMVPDRMALTRLRYGGSPGEGVAVGLALVARARRQGWREEEGRLLLDVGQFGVLDGDVDRAEVSTRAALEALTETAPDNLDIERLRGLRILASITRYRGDLVGALSQYEGIEALRQRQGADLLALPLKVDLGSLHSLLGNHDDAQRLLQEARVLARERGRRYIEMQVVENLAHACVNAGDLPRALRWCEESLALDEEIGGGMADDIELLRVVVYVVLGEFAGADAILSRIERNPRDGFGRGEELDMLVARVVVNTGLGRVSDVGATLDQIDAEQAALSRTLLLYGRAFAVGGNAAADRGELALAARFLGMAARQYAALGHDDLADGVAERIAGLGVG
jgi:eukaryotic-like serine/threonine-protein kinase